LIATTVFLLASRARQIVAVVPVAIGSSRTYRPSVRRGSLLAITSVMLGEPAPNAQQRHATRRCQVSRNRVVLTAVRGLL
jgi:hypothetical protein